MDIRVFIRSAKPKMLDIAKLLVSGKQAEAFKRFTALAKSQPADADPRLRNILAGLIVASVRARQMPSTALRKFEDPLTADDPLKGFEDSLTAFEDPLTAFDNPVMKRLVQSLLAAR